MTETVSDERLDQERLERIAAGRLVGDFEDQRNMARELLALRTPPQNTDGEAVAWPGDDFQQVVSALEAIEYAAHNDIKADGMKSIWEFARYGQGIAPRIRAALSAMKAERDAALLARDTATEAQNDFQRAYLADKRRYEEWSAEITVGLDDLKSRTEAAEAENAALKSDLTRYIDIATKEATEAESLREALAQSDADATAARIAIDRLTSERDALIASTGEHITKRSEYLARAEKAEAERDALAKALEDAASSTLTLTSLLNPQVLPAGAEQQLEATAEQARRAIATLQGDAK